MTSASSMQVDRGTRRCVLCGVLGVAVACGPRVGIEASSGESQTGGGSTGAPIDGDCAVVLAADPDGAVYPRIADDVVYWTGGGAVSKSPLDVGSPQIVLEVDDDIGGLAWTDGRLVYTTADRIERFDPASQQVAVLAEGQNYPTTPVPVGGQLFWVNRGAGILAGALMRLDDTAGGTVVLDRFGVPMGAVADSTHVYLVVKNLSLYDQFYDGALLRIDSGTQAVEILATPVSEPSGLALARNRVFWLEQVGPNFDGPGRVRSVAKVGGEPTTLATIDDGLGVAVIADERDVYFSVFDQAGSSVHRVDRASNTTSVVDEMAGSTVLDLALADDVLVVTTLWSAGAVPPETPSVTRYCRD